MIKKSEIYDKNLNFLLGSGASVGLLPTLNLAVKQGDTDNWHSVETLATQFSNNPDVTAHLFSWYVKNVISPAAHYNPDHDFLLTAEQERVVTNYQTFLLTVLGVLAKKKDRNRANIFTTNYDGMIAHTAEKLLRTRTYDFHLNDGGTGFVKRTLDAKNFGRYYQDHGVFDRHAKNVPQINLIQLHGSVYWYKDDDAIEISYEVQRATDRIDAVPCRNSEEFTAVLLDEAQSEQALTHLTLAETEGENQAFWSSYETLPIVNPTKWKFHETVFEEHYYQMLRLLSYELEKPNSVFIAFGFSFADEHILNLVKRSLSNPTLQLFICCHSDKVHAAMSDKFKGFSNVELVTVDGDLDFTAFNAEVFTSSSDISA